MKARKATNILLIIFIIMASVFGGLFVYKEFLQKDTKYIGTWQREVDITDYVTDSMDVWLGTAVMGNGTDYGTGRVVITMTLRMDKDGNWSESVDEASYESACAAAKAVALAGLYNFLDRRMAATDMSAELAGKTTEEIVVEAVGMSGEEYLEKYGPVLLPSLDDLKLRYNDGGTYAVDGNVMARRGLYGTAYETFAIDKKVMIIAGRTDATSASDSLAVSIGGDNDMQQLTAYPIVYNAK